MLCLKDQSKSTNSKLSEEGGSSNHENFICVCYEILPPDGNMY